jgi:hypothetical protein
MFTPARFIVFSGIHMKMTDNESSKRTESMNFYNLSGFESSKINRMTYHRRDSSNINID